MNTNQKSSADHIIEHLNAIDVDGETMQYIIHGVNMKQQMLRQLMMLACDLDINNMDNIRVYGINIDNTELENINEISNDQWQDIAEDSGLVWSLSTFADQLNDSTINTESILIRFINIYSSTN